MTAPRLGIVGVGVIGGSIALRARAAGMRVSLTDSDPDAVRVAGERGMADEVVEGISAIVERSDVVVIAIPVDAALAALQSLRDDGEGSWPSLLIDVASVKAPFAGVRVRGYVPTHPFAGSERTGPAGARADLFDGRAWAYVPSGSQSDTRAVSFIEGMGAIPVAIEAEEHDEIAAWCSHLPQVLSVALGSVLAERTTDPMFAALAGPGLRTMLRLAASSPAMWGPILAANGSRTAPAIREIAGTLGEIAAALEKGDIRAVMAHFADARRSVDTLGERYEGKNQ